MNTFLSPAQESQCEQYRNFIREELAPVVSKLCARESCLKEFLQKLGQKGYMGLNVPKEYGGQGGTLLDATLFAEMIGQHDAGIALAFANHVALIEVLKKFATDTIQSRYLSLLARAEAFGTLAFSEETAGTDFEAVKATVQNGSLSGTKTWVVTGDFATLFLVLAKENDQLVVHLLDRPSGDEFKLVRDHKLMGLQSAYINDIELKQVKLNGESQLKTTSEAKEIALYAMDVAKTVVAAAALGVLDSSMEAAVQHARKREQFGTNIGTFQGVQWKLADMSVESTSTRLLVYRAAWSCDGEPKLFRQYAAMGKWYATRAARFHSGEALQVMGASGLLIDGPIARLYDDAKVMEIIQGTAEFQKMLLVKELNI